MKTKLILVAFLLGIGILASCSLEESSFVQNETEFSEDDFVSHVEFYDLLSVVKTRTNPTMPPNAKTKGLLRARIARKSRGCNSGFGLCDFKLLPKSTSMIALEQTTASDEYVFEVVLDESSNSYKANLLLAHPLPEGFAEEVSSLKIDDDIYWIKDEETMTEINEIMAISSNSEVLYDECQTELFSADVYAVSAENVLYDSTLGEYGGYQIELVDNVELVNEIE